MIAITIPTVTVFVTVNMIMAVTMTVTVTGTVTGTMTGNVAAVVTVAEVVAEAESVTEAVADEAKDFVVAATPATRPVHSCLVITAGCADMIHPTVAVCATAHPMAISH